MKLRLFAFVLEGAAILSAGSERMLAVPMSFEPNAGQAPADVSYLGRNGEGAVLLKSNEVVFLGPQGSVGMRFPGASARVRMDATKEVPGVSHYFVGSTTIPDVRHYASVTYRDLYRGISLVLRGKPAEIEYDFVVAPAQTPPESGLHSKALNQQH